MGKAIRGRFFLAGKRGCVMRASPPWALREDLLGGEQGLGEALVRPLLGPSWLGSASAAEATAGAFTARKT